MLSAPPGASAPGNVFRIAGLVTDQAAWEVGEMARIAGLLASLTKACEQARRESLAPRAP